MIPAGQHQVVSQRSVQQLRHRFAIDQPYLDLGPAELIVLFRLDDLSLGQPQTTQAQPPIRTRVAGPFFSRPSTLTPRPDSKWE